MVAASLALCQKKMVGHPFAANAGDASAQQSGDARSGFYRSGVWSSMAPGKHHMAVGESPRPAFAHGAAQAAYRRCQARFPPGRTA